MKSPFPGLDPYIEGCGLWGDFHTHLIEKIYDTLAAAVPERYVVRTGERSYIILVGGDGKEARSFLPDVGVTGSSSLEPNASTGWGTAVAEAESDDQPLPMRPFIEEEYRGTFLGIYQTSPASRLITT